MVESGVRDYHRAKHKALDRLGMRWARSLPSNEEIESAKEEYQRLFYAQEQGDWLDHMRRVAVEVMHRLQTFDPRLVGPVLSGAADRHSHVDLHVRADPTEVFGSFLLDEAIPHRLSQKRLRFGPDRFDDFPAYQFVADDVPFEVVVFDQTSVKRRPLSPVDGRPMSRAKLKQVAALAAGA